MRRDVLDRRAPFGETKRQILQLLRDHGPLKRSEISEVIGKKSDATLSALLSQGLVRRFEGANPNSGVRCARLLSNFYAFVAFPSPATENILAKRYAEYLRNRGYGVTEPSKPD